MAACHDTLDDQMKTNLMCYLIPTTLTSCQKGYGHTLHTVLSAQGFDGFRSSSIRPLATLLLLVAHSDLHTFDHFGCEDRSNAAQAGKSEELCEHSAH